MQVQHLGQKYTGLRPESHTQAMFKATDAQVTGNHPVPISNFMNAQCKQFDASIYVGMGTVANV